jgi:hypothetical protein
MLYDYADFPNVSTPLQELHSLAQIAGAIVQGTAIRRDSTLNPATFICLFRLAVQVDQGVQERPV